LVFGRDDGEINLEQLKYDQYRLKQLYLQHGYLDAKIKSVFSKIDFDTHTANVQYDIVEGKQYKLKDTKILFDNNATSIDIKSLYPKFKLKKGDVFNITKLKKDQNLIKTFVSNKGYAYAKVNFDLKQNKQKGLASIIYHITLGNKVYIHDVIISGNTRTLDRVIRRNVYLAPKDLYSLTDFQDSIHKLKRTGFFESVQIEKKQISKDQMDLIVKIKEARTGNLIVGGGYGSYDGWMINAQINDKNILGSGLNLGFSYEKSSKKKNYNISLANPAIYDSIYSGSINVHRNESLITSIDDNGKDQTTLEKGFGVGIGRAIGRNTRVGMNYAYNNVDVTYDINSTDNSFYTTSSITPYINFNNTDDYFIPRHGILTGGSIKYAGLGGDAKYSLGSFYFKYFYSLEDLTDYDIIARCKTKIRMINDLGDVPDDTTFYLGGATSVRGYSSYAIKPIDSDHPFYKTTTSSVELSFPLLPSAKMRWAIFYDYGTIGQDSFTQIKKAGRGAVISWYSPIGPLQFIFSRAINPNSNDHTSNFEFSLGTKF
jgi:outer membrane protein insertion porin family